MEAERLYPDAPAAPKKVQSDFSARKNGYEVVTTGCADPHAKACMVCPNGDFLQMLIWFLGGGLQTASAGSPFCIVSPFHRRAEALGGTHLVNTAAPFRRIVK